MLSVKWFLLELFFVELVDRPISDSSYIKYFSSHMKYYYCKLFSQPTNLFSSYTCTCRVALFSFLLLCFWYAKEVFKIRFIQKIETQCNLHIDSAINCVRVYDELITTGRYDPAG